MTARLGVTGAASARHPAQWPAPPPVVAAASSAIRDVLTGPVVPMRVVAAYPAAAYLAASGPPCAEPYPQVLAVVAADAVRVPVAVLLAQPADTARLDRLAGSGALVGAGEVQLGALTVRVRRWWEPPRPRLAPGGLLPAAVRGLDAGLDAAPLAPAVAPAVGALESALRAGSYPLITSAVRDLVGRGPGSTPSGDDVLAGALVCLRALGESALAELVAAAVASRLTTTTVVSAALLRSAAEGRSTPQVAALVAALGAPAVLADTLAALLRVGASSGADLAHGVLVAARAVLPREAA